MRPANNERFHPEKHEKVVELRYVLVLVEKSDHSSVGGGRVESVVVKNALDPVAGTCRVARVAHVRRRVSRVCNLENLLASTGYDHSVGEKVGQKSDLQY